MIFDLSGITDEADLALAEETLHVRCDFPWSRMLGYLHAQGKESIPVLFSDLTRFAHLAERDGEHGHPHVHEDGDTAHIIGGRGAPTREQLRQAVWGVYWLSGRIEVERSLPEWAKRETLLAEAAHAVDFNLLEDAHRQRIFQILHGDDEAGLGDHGHDWWETAENPDYFATSGESFMEAFVHAFSDLLDTGDWGFVHDAHPGHGPPVREAVLELHAPQVFGIAGSRVVHDSHGGIRHEIVWPSLAEAEAQGRRGCRVCKP